MPATPTKDMLRPTWQHGFAHGPAESAFPGLWKGKIGHWDMGLGPSGSLVRELTAFKKDAVLTAMDAATDWVLTDIGYALDFAGDDDKLVTSAHDQLNGLTQCSLEILVKSDEIGTDRSIIAAGNGTTDQGFSLRYDDVGIDGGGDDVIKVAFGTIGDDADNSATESSATAQTVDRQHIVCTWSTGAAVQIYLDGDLDSPTNTTTGGLVLGSLTTFDIGEEIKTNEHWNGLIYHVRLYNRVLLPDEIRTLYVFPQAELVRKGLSVGLPEVAAVAGAGIRNPFGGPMVLRNPLGA